ncbi:MAG: carbohydrate ABC transporter permease [Verrucomicrobia bacterium]|nr:carbohydrate ABC transporter permease [Verrucomicrobiota bacterium]
MSAKRGAHWAVYAALLMLSGLMLAPLLVAVSTSLKDIGEIYRQPPTLLPEKIVWSNYREALTTFPFLRYLFNTLVVVALSVAGSLLSCTLVAYGFARYACRWSQPLFVLMLSTMMLPGIVTCIPTFILFTRYFHWYDTLYPLWAPAFFGTPFCIFLLRQFFRTIPQDLLDAARLDGCSELGIVWHMIVPLSKPALLVVAVFTFMWSWNDYLGPLLYLQDERKYTLALGLTKFLATSRFEQYGASWNLMMAASLVVMLPITVVFFLAQRAFIEGITTTGLKG